MTQNLTIGERVSWYRRRRGMSQDVLAGLVGRTDDWMSKVENNRIPLDRLSVIRLLADALDVSLGDLIGDPSLLEWTTDSGSSTIPALRAALMDYSHLMPAPVPPARDPESFQLPALERELRGVFDAYQAAPEQVRHHYLSRQLVLTWMRNAHGSPSFVLQALAQRMHVVR
ncbi:helix-turn-helix domain-containing protein [Nocardia sp. CA-135953]|uniref:helix-turn-helix domain-containing protein n=1 Tax=Nocardia sp. CA-135953 TaxID=3239978 RepID=UPI003D9840C2